MRQSKNRSAAPLALAAALMMLASISMAADWDIYRLPVEDNITGAWFIQPDTGFVVTSGGNVYRTVTGGTSWSALTPPSQSPLEDVCFLNKDTGIVCGRQGAIYRTTNGGLTWENHSLKDTMPWLLSTAILDSRTALVIGWARDITTRSKGIILRSTDAGVSWKELPEVGQAYGELFYRPGSPICFLSWGKLHFSRDLGATWQERRTLDGKPGRAVAFYGTFGVMVGNLGMGAYTHDGGNTWTPISFDEGVQYTSVAIVNAETAYAAGTTGVIKKTVDGGKTWEGETIPEPIDVADLCLTGKRLYAVGAGGVILRHTLK